MTRCPGLRQSKRPKGQPGQPTTPAHSLTVSTHMRKTSVLISLLCIFLTISCNNEPIEPFEIAVGDYDYSLAYSVLYKLTNDNLTITFQGELENEKDSVLFSTTELPKKELIKLSKLNMDNLSVLYSNPCIRDGDIKLFQIKKNGKVKSVSLQNYYHPELSPTIDIINRIVPSKFKMHYNKEHLITSLAKCGKEQIIDNWDAYQKQE